MSSYGRVVEPSQHFPLIDCEFNYFQIVDLISNVAVLLVLCSFFCLIEYSSHLFPKDVEAGFL